MFRVGLESFAAPQRSLHRHPTRLPTILCSGNDMYKAMVCLFMLINIRVWIENGIIMWLERKF